MCCTHTTYPCGTEEWLKEELILATLDFLNNELNRESFERACGHCHDLTEIEKIAEES
jgi:hypothetical protein